MKTYIRTIIVSMIILGLSAGQSHANDKAAAAIGGFLAGIITGVVIDDDAHHHRSSVYVSSGSRCYSHSRYGCESCSSRGYRSSGYWEIRHVRVWVPGHWEFVRNRCGDRIRIWKSGYYTTKPQKVWVSRGGRSQHSYHRH